MYQFKSLQSRLTVFMLLPVAVLLIAAGASGFVFARNSLLAQWREAAILQLQQEAHQVDMLLARPKEWVEVFQSLPEMKPGGHHIRNWVLEQLRDVEGVEHVSLVRLDGGAVPGSSTPAAGQRDPTSEKPNSTAGQHFMQMRGMPHGMQFHGGHNVEITPPRYDAEEDRQTVTLISTLVDENENPLGKLKVELGFDLLFGSIGQAGIWQQHRAYLVDDTGRILSSTERNPENQLESVEDAIGPKTLAAMQTAHSGTVMGSGHPPEHVAGFYRLIEAPWTLVIIGPGEKILEPILTLRGYYILFGTIFIAFILILLRWTTGRTVASIKNISSAAERVAGGDYSKQLPVKTRDEVGELTRSFNKMVAQLQERMRLKRAMDLAMEVQQNLLPQSTLNVNGLDIFGRSIYCDETGGDYFDFIRFREMGAERVCVAVGDVVGHGVAAALMMTSVRAYLRSAISQTSDLSQVAANVNRLLCLDTADTGNFMTMLFLLLDTACQEIRWVRAGHDPVIVYNSQTSEFQELRGEGTALGVNASIQYKEYRFTDLSADTLILIGTDGIWETENEAGEKFGRRRLKTILQEHSQKSSEEIVNAVISAVESFRGTVKQKDDVTLVVVKNAACALESRVDRS